MIYSLIAPIYDKVNSELNYSLWADFIEEICRRYSSQKPELALDLGCGTGRMTLELARRGYDMTGVDYSPDMLNEARKRAEKEGFGEKILWLCQDICDFELYGTVDLAVSCLDTVNHITESKSLSRFFSLVHNYLSPDSLFIFDVNGRAKFEKQYGTQSYVMEEEDSFCVWQNYYNEKTRLCDFYITLFKEERDGRYSRTDEVQRERMYTLRSLERRLRDTGFVVLGAFSDFEFNSAGDNDSRIYVVARCKKDL